MKKLSAAFGVVVVLAACSTEPMPPAPVAHTLPPKISLDVQTITLADRTTVQPANSPYYNNHFTPTISDAIRQWATDRMQAVGQSGQGIIIVKDASLVAQPMAMKDDWYDSWFTRQQAIKYVGHAEVSIEANGREGFATTDAAATRSVTLPENPTDSERQEAYYTLLNGLMKDLGQNLEAGIAEHVGAFVITAPVLGSTSVPMATPTVDAAPQNNQAMPDMGPAPTMPASGVNAR